MGESVSPGCVVRMGEAQGGICWRVARVQDARARVSFSEGVQRGVMVPILFELILQLVQGVGNV